VVTVDKEAVRALIAKLRAEQDEVRANLATITNLSGAGPGEPMRDMTDWFRARVNSEIGCLQDAIDLGESLLNA
jgi:hypothetical protein